MAYGFISILAAVISFAISAFLGKLMIPWLKKLKYGQTIKEIGPTWHSSKQGTPTMGGLMFIIGILIACAVCLPIYSSIDAGVTAREAGSALMPRLLGGIGMGVLYGAVGFLDDYIKVVKKRNTGLSAIQKIIFQVAIGIAYLATLYIGGDGGRGATVIPFFGTVELGLWFYPLALFVIVGFVNAVNLTDGIDGLCTSVTFFVTITLMLTAGFVQVFEMGIVAAAVAGGCLGFLIWNFYPAKVFMGDTGSLFLGGMFCALAFGTEMPVLIPLIGIIYLAEAGSVIIQRYYFKLTHGKRIFKMSPIHHHFEMSGWSEIKIVTVFSVVTVAAGIITGLLTWFGRTA